MKGKPASKAEPGVGPEPSSREGVSSRVAGSRCGPGFGHLLVAIDFSDSAAHALDYALALARNFHSEVTLLHVVEPTVYAPNALLGTVHMDELGDNLLESARQRLKKLKQKSENLGVGAAVLVRMGRAQSDIADTAKAIGADLIVMGTHGRNGARQLFLGGTAERVLRSAGCAVLVVPQAGG